MKPTSRTVLPVALDVLIVGGGISGLWLLDECRRQGYDALLVETQALGQGQTVASQGILHGGLKYSLAGALGTFVDAVKEMPPIWRACLAGTREPDLSKAHLRSEYCCVWQNGSFKSKLGQLGARFGLRTTASRMSDDQKPAPLRNCPGEVFRLDEQVIDPRSLLAVFAARNQERVIFASGIDFSRPGLATVIHPSDERIALAFEPERIVLAAGEGNAALREACGLDPLIMQRRPLPILTVAGNLPDLNGHCISTTKASAIITTQRISEGRAVWQVASETAMDMQGDFLSNALRELKAALPGFKWPDIALSSYTSTRAEAMTKGGERPTDAHVIFEGEVITAWPTKLVLAPRLAQLILDILPPPGDGVDITSILASWPRPEVAPFPWS